MSLAIDFSQLSHQDALDLAILIEKEAQERYEQFAEQLGSRYDQDAGDFFKSMANNEHKHGQQLIARRKQLYQEAPSKVSASMIWDVEAPGYQEPRTFMSVRQAFEIALNAERKAFQFFDSALKFIKDPQVHQLFEELREEEKQHELLLEELLRHLPEEQGPDIDDDDADEPPAL